MEQGKVFVWYIFLHHLDVLFHILCVFDFIFVEHMAFYTSHESTASHHVRNHQLNIWLNLTRPTPKNHHRHHSISEHNISSWLIRLFVRVIDRCGNNNGLKDIHFPDPEHDSGQDRIKKLIIQQILPKPNELVRRLGLGDENGLRPIVLNEKLRRIRQPGSVHPPLGPISLIHRRVSQVSLRVD